MSQVVYDVVVIGGGVCGCSLLYALSSYRLKTLLLEKENDVGMGATKANSAIVHAGYDPAPGSLMARSNVQGAALMPSLCAALDIPYKRTGSLVLGFAGDKETIEHLCEKGIKNGVEGLRILPQAEVLRLEPALNPEVECALHAPTAGIVSPWQLALAQAEAALRQGAELRLESPVQALRRQGEGFVIQTPGGEVHTRFLVNTAGVFSDAVTALLEHPSYTIQPSRGQYYLLDKAQGELVNSIIFQCPTVAGKGVLVAPTVHGNLIVGPNSTPAADLSTTAEGLADIRKKALRSVPGIQFGQSIRNFAGLRARSNRPDFILRASAQNPGFFEMGGIKSPGLTAAPALALEMVQMLAKGGLALNKRETFAPVRKVLRFHTLNAQQKAEAVRKNPLYGKIVCRCESVTEGEILDALHSPIPPRSLDAVKRRCNPGMGRCQGGFCGPKVLAILAREQGREKTEIPLDRNGMNLLVGETKNGQGRQGGKAR